MANNKLAPTWPVNAEGALILGDGGGSTKPFTPLNSDFIPVTPEGSVAVVGVPVLLRNVNGDVTGMTGVSARERSNVLSSSIGGFLGVPATVAADKSFGYFVQSVAEAPFDTFRIGILNASVSTVPGVKVAFGAGTTMGAANGTLGLANTGQPIGGLLGMQQATFGGATSVTLTASPEDSTGASGTNLGGSNCSVTWSDWMLNPSVPRADGTSGLPVWQVSIAYPPGSKRTFIAMDGTTSKSWETESLVAGRAFRVMHVIPIAGQDNVMNPAWNLASNGAAVRNYTEFPAFVIQYTLRNGYGETLVVYGDSIHEGAGANVQKFGWPREFQAAVSTIKNPVSICNLAVSGSNMIGWVKRVNTTIAGFTKANVFIPSLSPNALGAPIVATDITLARRSFAEIRQMFDKPGLFMFTSNIIPTNYAVKPYGTSDVTYRVAWNNEMAASGYRCADFDKQIAGPLDANGQYTMLPLKQKDGIHPNTLGYMDMGVKAFLPLWYSY